NCFLNSLARDFNLSVDTNYLHIEDIKIPVKRYSLLGAHTYDCKDFYNVVEKICDQSLMAKRIENSIRNMQLFLEKSKERFQDKQVHFLQTEQDLLIGHSFHPSPKSRDEFS